MGNCPEAGGQLTHSSRNKVDSEHQLPKAVVFTGVPWLSHSHPHKYIHFKREKIFLKVKCLKRQKMILEPQSSSSRAKTMLNLT